MTNNGSLSFSLYYIGMTKPFNEHLLWKGKIQKASYSPPVKKPSMDLLPLTYHGGQEFILGAEWTRIKENYCDPDGLPKLYAVYSKNYWIQVEERKRRYRALS